MAPKYFSSILCVKMSADDRGIHNASCENHTPVYFLEMSLNFALAQKENTSFTVDMRVIYHINDILNDSRQWASLYLDRFYF